MILSLDSFVQAPREYQEDILYDAGLHWEAQHATKPGLHRRRMYTSPTGCHARGERVMLSDGRTIAVEGVRVGDHLAGADGPRQVLDLHRGRQEMVRITPTKGQPFVVNLDHILTLQWTATEGRRRKGALIDVSVREWLTWSKTAKHMAKLVRCPAWWGDREPHIYEIDPYLLGVLIGDGCLSRMSITNHDPEVWEAIEPLARAAGVDPKRKDRRDRPGGRVNLVLTNAPGVGNPLRDALRELGLAGCKAADKFIPDCYKLKGSRTTRLRLLAGLLDTDGHLSAAGYEFTSASHQLALDVAYLARACGFAAYLREKPVQLKGWDEPKAYWRLHISGDACEIPCNVRRKQAPPRRQKKSVLRTGFTVEMLPEDDYFGFVVDGDHRYLMADFTLTHNTGKGSVELWLLQWAQARGLDAVIVTPSLEVIRGFLHRLGVDVTQLSAAKMHRLAQSLGIWTPTRLRNRINAGERTTPQVVIYDEAHHAVDANATSGDLFAACPYSIFYGFTATGYRGSPSSTRLLREAWGEPIEVMTWPEAVRDGWVAMPEVEIVPLVDDDQVTITGGDFQSKAASTAYESRLDALADLVCSYSLELTGIDVRFDPSTMIRTEYADRLVRFDHPTMVSVPSTEIAHQLCRAVQDRGVGASTILQDTKHAERTRAYAACLACEEALIQITVVGEGVDLQLVRLVDARPTMSPVSWAQQVGRITRPQTPAFYVCTNRNFERFAFLWAGCVPNAVIKASQEAFEVPSSRAAARHIGLESLGRFKSIPLPLLDGRQASMYMIYDADKGVKVEWCVIVAPGTAEALVARRVIESVEVDDPYGEEGDKALRYQYRSAKWVRVAKAPESIKGFKTTPQKGKLSANQAKWWDRKAASCGLHPHSVDITRRQFAALPVLADARMKMR